MLAVTSRWKVDSDCDVFGCFLLVLPKDNQTRKRDQMISRVNVAGARLINISNIISIVKANAVDTYQLKRDKWLA